MAIPKYKLFYQLMIEKNKELFDSFIKIHQDFIADPNKWEEMFHSVGRDVLDVIRDWERRLCSGTERGNYGQFSGKLSEKFWQEVKKDLPLIEQVGVRHTKKGG